LSFARAVYLDAPPLPFRASLRSAAINRATAWQASLEENQKLSEFEVRSATLELATVNSFAGHDDRRVPSRARGINPSRLTTNAAQVQYSHR
jgi:hypothetical protein